MIPRTLQKNSNTPLSNAKKAAKKPPSFRSLTKIVDASGAFLISFGSSLMEGLSTSGLSVRLGQVGPTPTSWRFFCPWKGRKLRLSSHWAASARRTEQSVQKLRNAWRVFINASPNAPKSRQVTNQTRHRGPVRAADRDCRRWTRQPSSKLLKTTSMTSTEHLI